jgi:citrate synthase
LNERYISGFEVKNLLGISITTVYSYVSRGLIKSIKDPLNKKKSLYSYSDVEKLLLKKNKEGAEKISQQTMSWGSPVLESSITLIEDNILYYRGVSIFELVKKYNFEQIATLLWTGDSKNSIEIFSKDIFSTNSLKLTFFRQDVQNFLSELDKLDIHTKNYQEIPLLGAKIIQSIVSGVTSDNSKKTIDLKLAKFFCPNDKFAPDLIKTALILIADHELNASSFTARVVASTGANLYQVIIAGFAALSGFKHGANVFKVEAMINDLKKELNFERNLQIRLERGDSIYGFGHNLYPDGDIRAKILLQKIEMAYSSNKELEFIIAIKKLCSEATRQKPNIDFALVTLATVFKLSTEFAFFLFALGRIAGWIGHAIEEYQSNRLLRPRAKYIGIKPLPKLIT